MASLRSLWRNIERGWDYIPLSLTGVFVGLAGFAVYYTFGREESDYVLFASGLVAMALVALSTVVVLLATTVLLMRLHGMRDDVLEASVDAGSELTTGFRFPSFRFWPFVVVGMHWDSPGDVVSTTRARRGWYEERIVAHTRGRVAKVVRRFRVRDVFGLAEFAFSWSWAAALRVAPSLVGVDASMALRDMSGEGFSHPSGEPVGDLVEMRRYGPGDPLRLVLWKTYARTRRLMVRMPERAIAPQKSTIACMIAGPEDEASASTARSFIASGLLGEEYRFVADGSDAPVSELEMAIEQLVISAAWGDRGGVALDLLEARLNSARLGGCILFVPARAGDWLPRVTAFARKLSAPPTFVVGIDETFVAEHRWRHRLLRTERRRQPGEPLPVLYDQLRALGGPVWVFHRPSGRLLEPAAIDALRETAPKR